MQVPQDRAGVPDDLPAAGGLGRVDPAVGPGECHRPRRDPRAWLGPARHDEPRIAADEVAEAGREPGERDAPPRADVGGDHLVLVEPAQPGDFAQVGTVVADADLDHLRGLTATQQQCPRTARYRARVGD